MAGKPGEFDLISTYFAPLTGDAPGAFGLADDAAVIAPPAGMEVAVTTDAMVAGVHFLADDPADAVAAKLLAVNLSDLAAMGAEPHAYTLATAWPRGIQPAWIEAFAGGLKAAQEAGGIVLVGGDTVATAGPMTLSLTAFGFVPPGEALRRGSAKPGERVYVSGSIGDAALGLRLLLAEIGAGCDAADRARLIGRYRQPPPRNARGVALRGLASSAIDISDGLAVDLGHVAAGADVDIDIDAAAIPLSEAARRLVAQEPDCAGYLYAGDDYELAFTAPPSADPALRDLTRRLDLPITAIGEVTAPAGAAGTVRVLDGTGAEIDTGGAGYRHF